MLSCLQTLCSSLPHSHDSKVSLPFEPYHTLTDARTHTPHALFSPPVSAVYWCVYIQELVLERLAVAGWGVWQFGQSSVQSVRLLRLVQALSLSISSRYSWLHHYYIMPNAHILSSCIWFDSFSHAHLLNFPHKCFCSYFKRFMHPCTFYCEKKSYSLLVCIFI